MPPTYPEEHLELFFEYVISRIFNFKSWNKYFLPPMERPWRGCQIGILRDQATVVGDFLLKAKNRFFQIIPSLEWPKMKHLVVFFDKIFQIAFCLTRSKKMTREILIFQICFWPLSVEFFWFLTNNFGKGLSKM